MGNKLEHPSVELPPEKLVMVTGGNTGIGYETAKAIAKMGARVCIACRSEDKAKAAIKRMQEEHQDEMQKGSDAQASSQSTTYVELIKPLNVEYMKLDLASLQSTMDFIQQTKETMQYLNVLVCNAGIALVKQEYTEDNYESHFQVNYLSHLLLVLHLLPLLRAGAPDSRIVLMSSSEAHGGGKLDLDNMQGRNSYSRMGAYACSKAYMVMAAHFLSRRLEETGVSTFAVDPGLVDTDIVNNYSDWKLMSFIFGAYRKIGMMRTPKQGAATSVVACVDPSLRGKTAVFMKNCQPANPSAFCCDGKNQEALWSYSLGCLDQFIGDSVLRNAFPSAKPDLLTMPKGTSTAKEKIADKSGKREGSLDDRHIGEKAKGGKTYLEGKQIGEEQPTKESLPGAAGKPEEKLRTHDLRVASAEDNVPGEKEHTASSDKKQTEENPPKKALLTEAPTKEVIKTDEETIGQEPEESMMKDSPPEQNEEVPDKEPSGGTPETGQISEDLNADAEVPSESVETSLEAQANEKTDDASTERTAGEEPAESEKVEAKTKEEPLAEAAPIIDQTAEVQKADAEIPADNLLTSTEPSGGNSEEKGIAKDTTKEETALASSLDSKQVKEKSDEECPSTPASEIAQTSWDLKPEGEAPTENLEMAAEIPSGQESEEMDDASTVGEAGIVQNEQIERQRAVETLAEAASGVDQTSDDKELDTEVPAESLQTSSEPTGQKPEESSMADDAASSESKQVEEQPLLEPSAREGSEVGKMFDDQYTDWDDQTESLKTVVKPPSGQELEERNVGDDASAAGEVSSENKQMEEKPMGKPLSEAAPEFDQISKDREADTEAPAEILQTSSEPTGWMLEESGITVDAAIEETPVTASSESKQVEAQPDEKPAGEDSEVDQIYAQTEGLETVLKPPSGQEPEEKYVEDDASTAFDACSENEQMEEKPEGEPVAEAAPEFDKTSEDPTTDAEIPAESLQISGELGGKITEESSETDDVPNQEPVVAASSDSEIYAQTEGLETVLKPPSGQESEEQDDASIDFEASSENKQMEEKPEGEPVAEAAPDIGKTSEDQEADTEVPAESLQTSSEPTRQESEESWKTAPVAASLDSTQVEAQPGDEARAGSEVDQIFDDLKPDWDATTENVKTAVKTDSGQECEETNVKDNSSTAGAASLENQQIEEKSEGEPVAEAVPDVDKTSEDPQTEILHMSGEVGGQKSEERGETDDAGNDETLVAASSDSKQVGGEPDEEASAGAGAALSEQTVDQVSEERSAQVPADTSEKTVRPEEDISVSVEDGERVPTHGKPVSIEKNERDAPENVDSNIE